MKPFEPAYLELHRRGELARRVEAMVAQLSRCRVCPRECDVDRLADEKAVCGNGRYARVASFAPHFGEENPLRGTRGSGTIFLPAVICAVCSARIMTSARAKQRRRFYRKIWLG